MKSTLNILFLVPEDYDMLNAKGITHMILERDENHFFDKVITVHPIATKTRVITLNETHTVYEFNLRKYFYPYQLGFFMPIIPLKMFLMIYRLVKIIKQEKIDMIRANDPYWMGLIAWILAKITGLPFCISLHSDYQLVFRLNPQKGFKNVLRKCSAWIPHFVTPKAQMLLPISDYLKKTLPKKVDSTRIKLMYHGIDFEFQPINDLYERFSLPRHKKIISYVARLSKDNYIDDILNVIEKLSRERNDFMLVMIGGGVLEPDIKNWITHHPDSNSYFKLLGYQSNSLGRSIRYISTISLCLMSGFSLIEAAAASTPLISYDVEWHGELVKTYQTGFLIKEHDLEALSHALNYLLDHPREAKEMGNHARRIAYERHELKNTTRIKQQYYKELSQC